MPRSPTVRALLSAIWGAKWALLFPVALVYGIRGGIFTPSEVGAFAVVYAVVIGVFFHRELTWERIKRAFDHAVSDIGLIMIIILMSGMVGFAIIYMQVPQAISTWMLTGISNPDMIVLLILLFLLIAGCFIESTVLVLLLTPIFVPIVKHIGIDPVHFGILMMSIVTLGGMTPPVGVAMFAVCSLLDVKVEEYAVEALPFVLHRDRADRRASVPARAGAVAARTWHSAEMNMGKRISLPDVCRRRRHETDLAVVRSARHGIGGRHGAVGRRRRGHRAAPRAQRRGVDAERDRQAPGGDRAACATARPRGSPGRWWRACPVSEDIKKQKGDWRAHIANYRTSLENLAAAGIATVCYNFMPVLDWTRTDLAWRLPNGGTCMRFDLADFAAFDIFILRREGARNDFPEEIAAEAERRFRGMSEAAKQQLARNVTCGLPGATEHLTLDGVRRPSGRIRPHQRRAAARPLRRLPRGGRADGRAARACGCAAIPTIRLSRCSACRAIMSTEADYAAMMQAVDSPANGITLCSGSLGVRPHNDLPGMMRRLGRRVHFVASAQCAPRRGRLARLVPRVRASARRCRHGRADRRGRARGDAAAGPRAAPTTRSRCAPTTASTSSTTSTAVRSRAIRRSGGCAGLPKFAGSWRPSPIAELGPK